MTQRYWIKTEVRPLDNGSVFKPSESRGNNSTAKTWAVNAHDSSHVTETYLQLVYRTDECKTLKKATAEG